MKIRKKLIIMAFVLITAYPANGHAGELFPETNNAGSDSLERNDDMRIGSEELLKGITEGKIQLLDIRSKEEVAAWRMGFSIHIPLNELPSRLNELSRDKIIVTACPHKTRSAQSTAYLRNKGFTSKYLEDGLVGLAEYLRGDRARDFINSLK